MTDADLINLDNVIATLSYSSKPLSLIPYLSLNDNKKKFRENFQLFDKSGNLSHIGQQKKFQLALTLMYHGSKERSFEDHFNASLFFLL